MNKEEAIKYLNEFIIFKKILNTTEEEAVECFELAVEALKTQPCEDCVSREAVLSIIKSICFSEEYLQFKVDNGSNGQRDTVINCIKALPSVSPQPSERTEERTETHECDLEHIIKTTIKEYLDKPHDDVIELLLALNKDLCERIRKENENGL